MTNAPGAGHLRPRPGAGPAVLPAVPRSGSPPQLPSQPTTGTAAKIRPGSSMSSGSGGNAATSNGSTHVISPTSTSTGALSAHTSPEHKSSPLSSNGAVHAAAVSSRVGSNQSSFKTALVLRRPLFCSNMSALSASHFREHVISIRNTCLSCSCVLTHIRSILHTYPHHPRVCSHLQGAKTLDSTSVLANRFVPLSLKALNQAEVSVTLTAGKIPSLYGETKKLYETLIPHGVECMCKGEKHRQSKLNHEAAMVIRRVPVELRYGLYSSKPLTIGASGAAGNGGNKSSVPAATGDAVASEDSAKESSDQGESQESAETKAEKKKRKKLETKIAALTGKTERERYETIVGLDTLCDAMTRETKDLKKASDFRDKFEGLLILERDEILRLYEYLSQYKVNVIPFAPHDGPASFLYAHVRIPGIADVQPSLSVGDTCLVRPVEPLQMPAYQKNAQMIYDHSRKAYVPNPIEIQASVLRIVRGRGGMPDEVVITWLSIEDDSALQHAWSYYPPDRRMYNVRFVPHAMFQERCLTALDWAARLPKNVADGLILAKEEEEQLNLPKYRDGHRHSAAIDGKCINIGQYSLNEKQHDFVSMCISRTIHASTERVREPMLLTGPAGVSKRWG